MRRWMTVGIFDRGRALEARSPVYAGLVRKLTQLGFAFIVLNIIYHLHPTPKQSFCLLRHEITRLINSRKESRQVAGISRYQRANAAKDGKLPDPTSFAPPGEKGKQKQFRTKARCPRGLSS